SSSFSRFPRLSGKRQVWMPSASRAPTEPLVHRLTSTLWTRLIRSQRGCPPDCTLWLALLKPSHRSAPHHLCRLMPTLSLPLRLGLTRSSVVMIRVKKVLLTLSCPPAACSFSSRIIRLHSPTPMGGSSSMQQ